MRLVFVMPSKSLIEGSTFGIIAYIAEFYGITSAHELLKRLHIKSPVSIGLFNETHLQRVLTDDVVAKDMGLYLPDLEVKTFERPQGIINIFRKIKNTKVCKQCLNDGGLHQDEWQFAHVTYCDEHSTALIDSCKHVYAHKFWPDKLRCKACTTDVHKSAAPLFHIHFKQLLSAEPENAYTFLFNLFDLAEKVFRPLDFVSAKVSWDSLPTPMLVELLEDAFMLGATEDTYEIWESKIREHRSIIFSLGDYAVTFGLTDIKNAIEMCDWQIPPQTDKNVRQILTKHHQRLNASYQSNRIHLAHQSNHNDISFTITSQILAMLIDVDITGLHELHHSGVLSAVRGNVRIERMSWDIRNISNEIRKVFKHKVNDQLDAVSLRDADLKVLDALLITPRKATLSLMRSELKGYLTVNATGSLVIRTALSHSNVTGMFKKELASIDHLSEREVSRLIGVTKPFIDLLIQNGFLRYARWQRHTVNLIDKTCIQDFLKEYVSINREALLDGAEFEVHLEKVVNCCGMEPTVVQMVYRNNTPLVLFKIEEMNTCCYQKAVSSLEVIRVNDIDVSGRVERFANYR